MRLLNAAGADPRIPPTYFRLLVRIAAALNEASGIAILGDDAIADEVPGFAQQSTRNRARRKLAELGYLDYEAGTGARVTHYRISDEPVPAILIAIDQARDRRANDRKARAEEFKRSRSNPAPVQATDEDGPCKSHRPNPAPTQSVHLQDTPSSSALRRQDVTHGSPPLCCSCGKPADRYGRASPKGDALAWCEECADDAILWDERLIAQFNTDADDAYLSASRG